jgi:uncharacterized Zn ribbon protein
MAKNNDWSFDDDTSEATDIVVKDCNGAILTNGDTVVATKDIKVK